MYDDVSFQATMKIIRDILFMAPRIKMIVMLNLLWNEFVETNERRFDLILRDQNL